MHIYLIICIYVSTNKIIRIKRSPKQSWYCSTVIYRGVTVSKTLLSYVHNVASLSNPQCQSAPVNVSRSHCLPIICSPAHCSLVSISEFPLEIIYSLAFSLTCFTEHGVFQFHSGWRKLQIFSYTE